MKIKFIKYLIFSPIDFLYLFVSIIYFKFTKITLGIGHKAMIRLFCLTGGWSNDLISFVTVNKKHKKKIYKNKLRKIVENLKENGYFVMDKFISREEAEKIEKYILKQTFEINKNDQNILKIKDKKFNPQKPEGVIYQLPTKTIVKNLQINKIINSSYLKNIASSYFGSEALLDHFQVSIVTNYKKKADKTSAQYYHFDLDKPKWLKFFIYLNDVSLDNGPHSFIAKTHKNLGIPISIRSKGYTRIEDKEVKKYFNEETIFTNNKGTCIIEDTRGLHKGFNCKKNYRCLLNIQYSNSHFGYKNEPI